MPRVFYEQDNVESWGFKYTIPVNDTVLFCHYCGADFKASLLQDERNHDRLCRYCGMMPYDTDYKTKLNTMHCWICGQPLHKSPYIPT